MKARITIELACEECKGRLNYHNDSTIVKCGTLKCKMRGVEFLSPTIQLEPVVNKASAEAEAKKAATVAKRKATMEANKLAKESGTGVADEEQTSATG